ncbi:MAG: glycoside hydrolase family 88 protein [Spirochaetales bacterium]|nr:glycoside hydrolase family 88 protein [Spirochaetales bacterium]
MIRIDASLTPEGLLPRIAHLFELSGQKILSLQRSWKPEEGTPVFTVKGAYTTRGWTEWTRGFQFGSALLQYDATGIRQFLDIGVEGTVKAMAPHVSHTGVHDHGFNTVSTYGNLLRLHREGRVPENLWAERFCELALKVSGAVQAARWTELPEELGYVYSFNGPHSLLVDTIRSLRVLAAAHRLGHVLMGEQDRRISLLERALRHAECTARYNVYYGEERDAYDVRGRTVHEAVFNTLSGAFRCPSTQQGYSPFSTWTRGLAWALAGYPEFLEFLRAVPPKEFKGLRAGPLEGQESFLQRFTETACALADFYIQNTPVDGIPYWDTGAPGLVLMPGYLDKPADPFNEHEPVDSSAAAVAAQGLLRLGRFLRERGLREQGERYFQAGLTVAATLFADPYVCRDPEHQGLILHSVYHRPNGWDYVPPGRAVPAGESSMWGDYHARELALYLKKLGEGGPYYTFWSSL